MDNVLITGASGFIGSFLSEEGIKRGYNIYAGVRKKSPRKYLTDPALKFIELDFSSVDALVRTLEEYKSTGIRFRYIIHGAGVTKARRKDDFMRVNYGNTRNFIDALIASGMGPDKFILVSSLAAYGPGDPSTMLPVMLSDRPNPVDEYGKSKLAAEQYLASRSDIPWIILRPTGVYGPREKDYFVFFKTVNSGIETYIGRQEQILTFIYVKDLVSLVFDALASSVSRKSYFVSDGREYTGHEFAAITKRHLGKKTLKITLPSGLVRGIAFCTEKVSSLWGTVPTLNTDKFKILNSKNWRCEVEPLRRDFHFEARYDLDRGVKETLDWYFLEGWLKK